MICPKCNSSIGPEELKCPYCGADNPFAATHDENMRKYDKSYRKTKRDVITSAEKTGSLARRAIVLAALIILSIIMLLIASYNYSDKREYKNLEAIKKESYRNADALAEEAEGYLKRGEYMDYYKFLQVHEISNFLPDKMEHMKKVTYVAENYSQCMSDIENMVLRSTDPDYWDNLDNHIFSFSMYIDTFYEVYEAQSEYEENELYRSCMDDMKLEIEIAMKTYFDMDDDELEEFLSMSEAQKGVKLTEVLRNE